MKDIFEAASDGDLDRLRQILDQAPEAVQRRYMRGHPPVDTGSPLHVAVQYRQNEAVRLLIERNSDIEARDASDMRPLHHATMDHRLEILQMLIDRKADINARDCHGNTPLHYVVMNSFFLSSQDACLKAADTLIRHKADPGIRNEHGLTPLHLAITKSREKLARFFIENGANIHEKTPGDLSPADLARGQSLLELADFIEGFEQIAQDRALKRNLEALDRILLKSKNRGIKP